MRACAALFRFVIWPVPCAVKCLAWHAMLVQRFIIRRSCRDSNHASSTTVLATSSVRNPNATLLRAHVSAAVPTAHSELYPRLDDGATHSQSHRTVDMSLHHGHLELRSAVSSPPPPFPITPLGRRI